jgi:hypothetical protein
MVFWIDASSTGTITQGLKGICNLPEALPCALDGSPESALWWIGSLKDNYAMVFDNADALSPAELEAYFPSGQRGNILITSRNSAMQRLTLPQNSLEVKEMEENDAIELLLKASCLDPSRTDLQAEASKIVKELFCLPLAVDQAGAFIASGATSISDYISKYTHHQKTLFSHPEFKGASKYNRTVYGTWELSYNEIQQRAQSSDSHQAEAAKSALLLLAIFPFFHHEGIIEGIFSYAAVQNQNIVRDGLPLASSILDSRLLPLNERGTWDNFMFREGSRVLMSFCLTKQGPSDGVYSMHPLVHTWGRDRMTLEEREKKSCMAYVILSCSLRNDTSQPYAFRRSLVTHVRANMQQRITDGYQISTTYLDDACDKFGFLLSEQGYFSEAEKLQVQVINARSSFLKVKHSDTVIARANLAATHSNLEKFTEAEKPQAQVLDANNRKFRTEHPDTTIAMANLAVTLRNLESSQRQRS